MTTRVKPNARRLHGFTLVEMMVALFAGSVVISGAYFLSGKSANNFNDQMSLADTQTSLRMAVEQVRRDFARAGYLGSRDSDQLTNTCGEPTSTLGRVVAATVTQNGSATALGLLNIGLTATTNRTRADLVRLQGAYAVPSMFPVANTGVIPAPNVIQVDNTITSFQMAFANAPAGGGPGVYDPLRFNAAFFAGRGVRFESDGRFYFRRITASDGTANPPTITLDANLPLIGCAPRAGAFVAPISMIEYAMEPVTTLAATTNQLDALVPRNPTLASAQRAVLVRRERNYTDIATNPLVAPAAWSVVLDNAVEFQVHAIVNTAAAGFTPVFAEDLNVAAMTATPAQLRSLVVTLSARSAEGDRLRAHLPRAALNLPMLTFIGTGLAAGELPYVSRVRTMRAEIFLPNTVNL